jgi:hypothetical protein
MAAAEHSPEERRRAIKFFSHLHHPQSQSVLGGDKEHSPQNIKRIIRGFGGSHLKATSSRKKVESDIKSRLHPIAKKPEAPQHQLKTQTETKLVDQKGAPIQVAGKQEAPVHKLVDQHEKPVSSAPVVEGAKETPTLGEEHKGLSTGAKVGLTLGGVALAGGGAAAIHHHHNKNKK